MKVYISGLISAGGTLPATEVERNKTRFYAAADALRLRGHTPLNPLEGNHNPASGWADYMRVDLRMLLLAEGILLLPGWEASRGARLEHHVAQELGLQVLHLYEVLDVVLDA